MRRVLLVALLGVCVFVNFAHAQRLTEPKLVGTWWLGNEDYNEFIYHRMEVVALYDLKENPDAKMVARLCSKSKMSVALVSSPGFAYTLREYAERFEAPAGRIFFARWGKCDGRAEEYWVVPGKSRFEYDELTPIESVRVGRWLVGYYEDPSSRAAQAEFASNLSEFVAELKSDPRAEGFVISNVGTRGRGLREALRRLRAEKLGAGRFRVVKKRGYTSYHPEFMTVTVTD